MFEYILFDLDGTIINSKEGVTKSVQHALRHFDIHVENLDDLTHFIGPPLGTPFKDVYGMNDTQVKEAVNIFRQHYHNDGLFQCSLYPGIAKLIEELYIKGKKIAVSTSKVQVNAIKILDHFNLSKFFHTIVGSELDGTRSNKRDVVKEALDFFNVSEEDKTHAILIGDRKYDIIGAKECGISCAGVRHGFADPGELEEFGADFIVSDMDELRKILL